MQWHIISILYACEFIFAGCLTIHSLCLHFGFPYTTLHTSQHGVLVGDFSSLLIRCIATDADKMFEYNRLDRRKNKHTHQKMFSNDLSCNHDRLLQVPVSQRKTLYFRESGTLLSRSKCTLSLGTPLFLTNTPALLYTTLHFCLLLLLL